MSKVIFEFDEREDNQDINIIVNRAELLEAAYKLSDLFSKIYNGKIYDENDCIYLKKDGSKATAEDYSNGELPSGGEYYLRQKYIEDELDDILNNIRHLINY